MKQFERGNVKRAYRDVFARHITGVDNPYAVATYMVKEGATPEKKNIKREVKTEFKEQKSARDKAYRKAMEK